MEYELSIGVVIGITVIFLGFPPMFLWNFPWVTVCGFAILAPCLLIIIWMAVLETKPRR